MNCAGERNRLLLASKVYACSTAQIKRHWIPYPELGEISRTFKNFERSLGGEAAEEYWRTFLWRLRRYQFLLLTLPLSSDHPAIYSPGSYDTLQELLSRCDQVYPDFANGAHDLLRRYAEIAARRANPSLQEIVKICTAGEPSRTALVLKETRFITDVEEAFSQETLLRNLRIVGTQHVRGETCYDNLILLGALRWYPEYVCSAPRAHRIYIVSYNWLKDEWKSVSAFAGAHAVIRNITAFSSIPAHEKTVEGLDLIAEPVSPEDLLPEVNWDQISLALSRRTSNDLDHEQIEARLFSLESGAAVFVDATESTKMLVIDLAGEIGDEEVDQRTSHVKRVPVSLIETGMFILLRTSGGGDYLMPLADKILGTRAREARTRQEHWKGLLREKVREKGLLATSIDLLDRGSVRAEESNVRNWASSRNIRPHDKSDFVAIMRLIGMEEKIDEYWKNAKAINSAHMKAGFYIRRLLLKKVADADLEELRRTGNMDFELRESGAGGLTAYRIVTISQKQYLVPVSYTGRPFENYEDLWQE